MHIWNIVLTDSLLIFIRSMVLNLKIKKVLIVPCYHSTGQTAVWNNLKFVGTISTLWTCCLDFGSISVKNYWIAGGHLRKNKLNLKLRNRKRSSETDDNFR